MESACSVNGCTALLHLKAVTGPISKGTDTELRPKRKREHIPTYSKALRGIVGHRHWHLGLTSGWRPPLRPRRSWVSQLTSGWPDSKMFCLQVQSGRQGRLREGKANGIEHQLLLHCLDVSSFKSCPDTWYVPELQVEWYVGIRMILVSVPQWQIKEYTKCKKIRVQNHIQYWEDRKK